MTERPLSRGRLDLEAFHETATCALEQAGFVVAKISRPFCNRGSGELTRLLFGRGGEFAWHWSIGAGCRVPFMHRHEVQDELLKVLAGEIQVEMGGSFHTIRAGEELLIPAGRDHRPFNSGPMPAIGIVRFHPPLDGAELSLRYWELVDAGHVHRLSGRPVWWRLLLKTYPLNPTLVADIPAWLQRLARRALQLLSRGTSLWKRRT